MFIASFNPSSSFLNVRPTDRERPSGVCSVLHSPEWRSVCLLQRNTTPTLEGAEVWVCVWLCVCCCPEKRKLSNGDQPLWERILQGPSDDIMKIFLMDRDEEEVSIDVSPRAPPPHWALALIPRVQHCQNWECTIRGVKQSHPWQKWGKMKRGQHSLKRQPPVQYLNSPVEGSNGLTGQGLH